MNAPTVLPDLLLVLASVLLIEFLIHLLRRHGIFNKVIRSFERSWVGRAKSQHSPDRSGSSDANSGPASADDSNSVIPLESRVPASNENRPAAKVLFKFEGAASRSDDRSSIETILQTISKLGWPSWRQPSTILIRALHYHQLPKEGSPEEHGDSSCPADLVWMDVTSDSGLVGHRLRELVDLGLTGRGVLGVRQGDQVIPDPGGDLRLREGDALLVFGTL